LLDFDVAAQAEAARDLANLDVHLKLRLRLHLLTPTRYLTTRTQVLAASEELNVSPARFHAYADATWLRLACLYSFRPGFASLAASFLEEQGTREQNFSVFNAPTISGTTRLARPGTSTGPGR
jgi:hypothetical protein